MQRDVDRADRVSSAPRRFPGKTRDRQRVVGAQPLGRTRRHRHRRLGADGPVLEQQALGHIEQLHAGIVATAHDTAGEKFARAAEFAERVGEQAAGRRLHHREPLLLRAQ